MDNHILLVDFGSTYTKLTMVDVKAEEILQTVHAPTSIQTDIMDGFEKAFAGFRDDLKATTPSQIYAASSAGGGLKIVASGLVPELTATAAKMTALNAGGKVLKVYSFELTEDDIEDITEIKPDIVLLTGGTDGGNKRLLMENVQALTKAQGDFTVVLACNRTVVREAESILVASGKKVVVTENVMPKLEVLNIEPARTVIREIFLQDIIKSKGLSRVEKLIDEILMPTPSAVMAAVNLLSKGHDDEEGLGSLLAVDVGGATTDVYSADEGLPTFPNVILKGFMEPYLKRTVEGDLGMRHNADHIVDETGLAEIVKLSGLEQSVVDELLERFHDNPSMVPTNEVEAVFDRALAHQAIRIAVERHAGHHYVIYTIEGANTVQQGKDLSNVGVIIGTGGSLVHSKDPKSFLEKALYDPNNPNSLKPKNAKFLLDANYILSAMGLLSAHHPKLALRIMKKNLQEI